MEFMIAMKGANTKVLTKNMNTITKDTKRTTEVGTDDATEAIIKELEAAEATRKAANLANNKKPCNGTQMEEGKQKTTLVLPPESN